jgi:ATP-dependent DNA helicase RecQ
VPDSLVASQKILSCVARVKETYGVNYVVSILRGEASDDARRRGHDKLSTFGLLRETPKADLQDWIHQLIGQNVLRREGDEYPVLKLNPASWEVMRGERPVQLLRMAATRGARRAQIDTKAWEGVDTALFETLRQLRRRLSVERSVPPYVIFSDAVLRHLARERPTTEAQMRQVAGVGDVKLREFGPHFLPAIRRHVAEHPEPERSGPPASEVAGTPRQAMYFQMFEERVPLDEICRRTGYRPSTILRHLCDYVEATRPKSIQDWIPDAIYARVAETAARVGMDSLRTLFEAMNEQVPYGEIKLVVTHLRIRK